MHQFLVATIMTTILPVRQHRTHSIEFKTGQVTMCRQPGISVSAVALAHGVNANLLRRWMEQFPIEGKFPAAPAPAKLVPVQLETVNTLHPDGDIQFDIQRGTARINIRWPVTGAAACARWLDGWMA